MLVSDIIARLLPEGTDAFAYIHEDDEGEDLTVDGGRDEPGVQTQGEETPPAQGAEPAGEQDEVAGIAWDCPTWPPDLFAIAGRIIEESSCYTMASPDRGDIARFKPGLDPAVVASHTSELVSIANVVDAWSKDPVEPPKVVKDLWVELVTVHASKPISEVEADTAAVSCVLRLFAIADEACRGMGWGDDTKNLTGTWFSHVALLCMTGAQKPRLHLPRSFCCKVPPQAAVVLPKSITASVGCTIRSLSHYLALLPPSSVIDTSWTLPFGRHLEEGQKVYSDPYDIRLLLVPFPFHVPAQSFVLNTPRVKLGEKHYWPAYFGLEQKWLETDGTLLSGETIANDFVIPLIKKSEQETGKTPHGIVLPECALSQKVAEELVSSLSDTGIEFVIAGVMYEKDGKTYNRACTFVINPDEADAAPFAQNKHHRWRLDRGQTERYALDFDSDHENDKWWEDIDVSRRTLPFFGLRKEMSFVTLICEDLARSDPAMSVIRAIGPNLVVALLMDGPQLAARWPGKYATVLAEDPGSAVLTLTCAGMVDRANWPESRPARSIALWRDGGGKTQEIGLPDGASGVMLTLQSKKKHQSTLDLRSDHELSRQLVLRTIVPVFVAGLPAWV